MGSIRYAADAVADLMVLRNYIAQENPDAARRVADRIVKTVSRLAQHPRLGKPGRVDGTRELVIPSFRMLSATTKASIICNVVQNGFR